VGKGRRGSYTRPVAGARKVVTVVFADVAGFTALGEALDPEAVRRVIARYFGEARSVLEQHGGKVEKFIGDAVMAVFGIPLLHDDDALRAVRAATELQGRVAVLNDELERDWGVRIAVRTGINTGEVVAGDEAATEAFATGDAVNVAARLEQAAGPGEILIGDATQRLLREAIRVEAVAPFALKGKAEPVRAWRLLEVLPDIPAFTRPIRAPFIGREAELAELEEAFARAVEQRSCRLVTVLGPPGIGKSRLARELCTTVGEQARVVVGRCVPYGEGITYWPLAEIVEQVAGRDPTAIAELIAEEENGELITERIAGAIGRAEAGGRSEEIAWAVRRLLEALVRERPLVVVLDDIHWAEPTFLDLIEYLAGFTSGPVLFLALARPDLLDERASWTMPRPNASTILLEPLSERQAETLIEEVGGGTDLPESALRRIVEASEGNPLFLEQMVAFQAEERGQDDEPVVPPTIQALLAARIDRLEAGERAIIERASVEGRSFNRGVVSELLPEEARASLGGDLMSLVRKGLIRPDRAQFTGDDGFRFVHVLVQDAAYAAIAKELRAELHERLAAWLEQTVGERLVEYEEILGYHLEQAYRYRAELGPIDHHGRELGRRAAELLAAAAERAEDRGDQSAKVNLLFRVLKLLPDGDPTRLQLLPELGTTLMWMGDFARADVVVAEAITAAGSDACAAARARIARADLRGMTMTVGSSTAVRREVERAIQALEKSGDDIGLAKGWALLAWTEHAQGHEVVAQEEWKRSIEHARRAGSRRGELEGLTQLAWIAVWGPTPRVEALRRCYQSLEGVKGHPDVEAQVLAALSCLRALEGSFEEARALYRRRAEILNELGLKLAVAWGSWSDGWVELRAGDSAEAESLLRSGYETLEELDWSQGLQIVGSFLARAVCIQGRFEEAKRLALSIEQLDPASVAEVATARSVRAKAAAGLGQIEEGERLAREAVALIDQTEFLVERADARMDLAEVLLVAGRSDEAAHVLHEALRLHEQKGNLFSAERTRALLTELGR
jgi:class 3 adenylate cyclase/tetratricopeptide (TPR) repeat protein